MKKQVLYLLAVTAVAAIVFVIGCQKETSFEGSNSPAKGSLQSDATGDCLPKTVNGIYSVGTALIPGTNTITVQVNVTQTGTYVVTTDTVNGYFFRAVGTFTALGPATVVLRGNGTPFAQGTNNFVVSFDGTVCDIQVDVLPAGAGAATFTLVSGGSPTNCASASVQGTYTTNATLVAATNYVDITVNVSAPGSYTITAVGGGMTFTKTGVFSGTGNQTVRLDGSGTAPGTAGAVTVPFTVPAAFSSCNFTVNVTAAAGPAVFNLVAGGTPSNCASASVKGVYVLNTALLSSNYVDITVNVTSIGSYTISASGGGMTFSKTGSFTVTGNQTVKLDGSATPNVATGDNVVTFAAPFASCSFNVYVLANDYFPRSSGSNWSYEIDGDPNDSLYRTATANTITAVSNSWTIFMQNDGVTPPPDSSGYYRRNAGDYYEWFDYAGFIGYDTPPEAWAEYIMLKDNVGLNTIWKSNGFAGAVNGPPPQSLNIRFSYKIILKDGTVTVKGVAYNNVITVEEKYEAEVSPGVWQDITTALDFYGKSYYARGIGLILYESLNAANAVTGKMELRRWQVK